MYPKKIIDYWVAHRFYTLISMYLTTLYHLSSGESQSVKRAFGRVWFHSPRREVMESMDRTPQYKQNSLSLVGAIALGTGVMIGAGILL